MPIERVDPRPGADEITTLREFLDYFRATLRRQVEGLDEGQLHVTIDPSPMTLGGMVKHLAFVESWWFNYVLAGRDEVEPWASVDWRSDPDWDWESAAGQSPAELEAMLVEAIAESDRLLDEALARGGLDQRALRERKNGQTATLRWILVHMIEEYARHCGHADLLRESIDGATDL